MGTTQDRERKINYILQTLRMDKSALVDKEKFMALASLDLLTTESTIKGIIETLEKADKIDKRIWK